MDQDTVNGNGEPWRMPGQQFWNSTVTNLSHSAKDLWKSPRATMIRIEVLVSLVAGVLILLAIFGSHRRRSRNGFLQKGVFMAYTLSYSLAIYILGSMQSSGVKSSMYPIWAISLIMLHGCTDSITAYNMDDNTQQGTLVYQTYMYFAYALLFLISMGTVYTYPLFFMALIAFFKYAHRLAACRLAGYSWNWSKIVADYMHEEQNKGVFTTMEDCSYLVEWPISKSKFDAPTYAIQLTADPMKDEVIDIRKVWRCKEMSAVPELRDACLSFSLFHLLRCRCAGFACDEYKDNAHKFVFGMLLEENKDCRIDYNRVFKVIEVELAFMYDVIFTKYAVIYYESVAATVWSLISIVGLFVTAYITVRASVKIPQVDSGRESTTTDNTVITIVILASTALLEFLQVLLYWTGIWGRVSFVCQFIREKGISDRIKAGRRGSCLIMGLKEFLVKIGIYCASNKHYWEHKIGQYSLLDSVSCNPSQSIFAIVYLNRMMMTGIRMMYLNDYAFIHPVNNKALAVRRKVGKSVELPEEVKEAVIHSLKRTGGTLSNGKSSLQLNGAHHLLWSCECEMQMVDQGLSQTKQNQTHIILAWHIATWYCEMATLSPNGAEKLKVPFSIATKLSRYCAYLVVSAPRLLPGHHYETVHKFDAAVLEAIELLKSTTWTYEDMKSLVVPQETNKIFERGVKLGQQLGVLPEVTRWDVMADFWAEMMLYIAPSDNVKQHIQQLAQGGEFITHLWALLSHAGIVKREQEDQAGGVRPTPSASSCIVHTGDLEAGP